MGGGPSDLWQSPPGQTTCQGSGSTAAQDVAARPSVTASEAVQTPERPPAETAVTGPPVRRLLAKLRDLHAHGDAPLSELVRLVASEVGSEVCSIYVRRPGDLLELAATEGLNVKAVGMTRLRVGEGIVGLCAAQGAVMNLPDAQNHPAFAYRPETGEEPFASMLAVPVRRSGRVLGVLAVQNRLPRHFTSLEVDELETVAML